MVLLTDHDTLEARRRGEEGWHGSVLVLVGEEVSPLGRDHYLAFGIEDEIDHRGLDAAGICRAVRNAGGFGFAAHPFSRGSERFKRPGMPFGALDCDAIHGIELWSFVTDTAERMTSLPETLRFVAAPGRVLDHPPAENMRAWDELCRTRQVVAIGGLDAHQFGKRIGPVVPLRVMAYHRSFRFIRTHVLCPEPLTGELERDRELVYDALRAGRCYIAVDAVAPARGFRFEADDVPMGGRGAGRPADPARSLAAARAPAAAARRGGDRGRRGDELDRGGGRGAGRVPGGGVARGQGARADVDPLEPDLPALNRPASSGAVRCCGPPSANGVSTPLKDAPPFSAILHMAEYLCPHCHHEVGFAAFARVTWCNECGHPLTMLDLLPIRPGDKRAEPPTEPTTNPPEEPAALA